MEKNYKIKISPILKISFLLVFVVAGFFGFGFVKKVLAVDCKAEIKFNVAEAYHGSPTVNINGQIKISGWVKSLQYNSQGSTSLGVADGYCNTKTLGLPVHKFLVVATDDADKYKWLSGQLGVTVDLSALKGIFTSGYNKVMVKEISLNPYDNHFEYPFEWTVNVNDLLSSSLLSNKYSPGQTVTYYASVIEESPTNLGELLTQATPASVQINNQTYGCAAGNNVYACSSSGTKSDCSDVPNSACKGKTCEVVDKSQCGGSSLISITSGTYADKAQVPVRSSGLPAGGTVTFYINGNHFDDVDVDDKMSTYTIDVDVSSPDSDFKQGANVFTAQIYGDDGNPVGNLIQVGTITVGSGTATACTGGPARGTCSSGQLCSAVTGGTCSAASGAGGQTSNSSTALYNPIPGYNSLTDLLVNIMKGFLGILAVWAVAFIVIGGFRMVVSSGSEEAVLAAKKTITWAVLGLLVAVMSFAIIAIVQNIIGVNVKAPTPPASFITPINKNT